MYLSDNENDLLRMLAIFVNCHDMIFDGFIFKFALLRFCVCSEITLYDIKTITYILC